MTLQVLEIFASLQGEGYWSGVPMTFVRLAGCNAPALGLGCLVWCDTPDSWDEEGGEVLEAETVLESVALPRLCLTGGEPLLQIEGVLELLRAAEKRAILVHLETNGTVDPSALWSRGTGPAWSVVSPKPPRYFIASGWRGAVDELKLVVDDGLDAATAERLAAAHPEAIVSLQPEWGEGRDDRFRHAVVSRAVELVMAHPAWRLSLQLHKFLGIR